MNNKAMQRKLEKGDALDVFKEGKEIAAGLYKLNRFVCDVDYCDAQKEYWIWSIGQHYDTNEIFAATDSRFYLNDQYRCLFLR